MIMMHDGSEKCIKDIYNDNTAKILTVDPNTMQISSTFFRDGFVKKSLDYLIRITLTNGKILECTREHLWLVGNKWVETYMLDIKTDKLHQLKVTTDQICFEQIGIGKIEYINPEEVYDFTTISENHSFIANGIVSHNCIPSRMTINMLMESVLGKSCCIEGDYGDATPFTSSSVPDENSGKTIAEQLCDRLGMNGYQKHGNEMLYNGMTGEPMGMFFIGPVYYQRLKHLVSDKVHARSTGPVTTLTRQPLEGRSRDGGLRFGEMERDAMIAHGAPKFLQERLFEQSDKYSITICENCGNFATTSKDCKVCETNNVVDVKLPFISKLVIQELNAMMIKTKIIAK